MKESADRENSSVIYTVELYGCYLVNLYQSLLKKIGIILDNIQFGKLSRQNIIEKLCFYFIYLDRLWSNYHSTMQVTIENILYVIYD